MSRKLIGILVFVIISICFFVFLNTADRFKSASDSERQKDLAIIESSESKDTDVYQALGRMARSKDKQALEESLKRATHPSRITREGAANALGHFTDDRAFAALQKLLQDTEPNVRIRTLQALANADENRRLELIVRFLEREDLSLREKIIANSVLARKAVELDARDTALNELVEIANSGNDLDHLIAFSRLTEIAPNDSETIGVARSKLSASKNPEMVAHAIRHLSALNDQALRSQLSRFTKSQDPRIRHAAEAALNKKQ